MCDSLIGVLGYVRNDSVLLNGVFKHRWEDFHVHEIDESGTVITLTNELVRSKVIEEIKQLKQNQKKQVKTIDGVYMIPPSIKKTIQKYNVLSPKDLVVLEIFVQLLMKNTRVKVNSSNLCKTYYCIIVGNATDIENPKEYRKQIHTIIRDHFPFLLSDTIVYTTGKLSLISELLLENVADTHDLVKHVESDTSFVRVFPRPPFHKNCLQSCKSLDNTTQKPTSTEIEDFSEPSEYTQKLEPKESSKNSKQNPKKQKVKYTSIDRWPNSRPDYLIFHLRKCNRDTSEAIQMISRCAHCPPKLFTFAGTKDRRGITIQRICAYRFSIEQLKQAIANPNWDTHVRVGDCYYSSVRLQLGSLSGNRFRVCIRGIDPDAIKKVEPAYNQLKQNGFINYFGAQRFGSRQIKTYIIGAAIARKDFETAVKLILSSIPIYFHYLHSKKMNNHKTKKPKADFEETNDDDINKVDSDWISDQENLLEKVNDCLGDIKELQQKLPKYMYIEKLLLCNIMKYPDNYLKVLQDLPTQILTLYIHSMQSLIWNHIASHRRAHYGLDVKDGDFIIPHNSKSNISTPIVYNHKIHSSTYCIEDVVLPIPGAEIAYPEELEPIYESYMRKFFNLPLNVFQSLNNLGLGLYCGVYRHFIAKPFNCQLCIIPNTPSGEVSLIYDEHSIENLKDQIFADKQDEFTGKAAALLECSLPKSSYLTMCFREMFKDFTSLID